MLFQFGPGAVSSSYSMTFIINDEILHHLAACAGTIHITVTHDFCSLSHHLPHYQTLHCNESY